MLDYIKIQGAREHNLKNINVDIPKNKIVVITGVSGSGKSSLAFDTIYAEGQRRYVESLSAYARQFLGIMDKPDVDYIEGLSPSISIDQKTHSHNPRSTVGTITEIYDYLRLLFARVGHPHCPTCHIEITKLSVDEMVNKIKEQILADIAKNKIKPHKFLIVSPIVREKKGEFKELFDNIKSKGYTQVRIDSHMRNLDEDFSLIKTNKHTIEVVIDSLSLTHIDIKNEVFFANVKSRLTASVEQALQLSDGLVILVSENEHLYSEKFSCPNCNLSLPELEPRMFSFNSPLGACAVCKGLGTLYRIDPDRILNSNLTIHEGAILPFNRLFFQDTWYIRLLRTVAQEEGIDFNKKVADIDKTAIKRFLYGTGKVYEVAGTNRFGKNTMIYEKYEGIIPELERKYFNNESGYEEYAIHKYMKEEICSACRGKKLKPEILSITIDKKSIMDLCSMTVDALRLYIQETIETKFNQYEKDVAKLIVKEIVVRLTFLNNVGLGYLTIERSARSLSGGELQRIRLASQIGTGLTGVLYVLDEPSIGLHPKDVSALLSTLSKLRNLGNTILIVEHDKETIEFADYVLELGPRAGKAGGHLIFNGTVDELEKSNTTLTGQYLSGKKIIAHSNNQFVKHKGEIIIRGAKQYNLKNIDVTFPMGNLIGVTGVSGSGKSTLVAETLYPALKYYLDGFYQETIGEFTRIEGYQYLDRVYMVDQSPIGRTPRSNPATYIGFFDEIRDIFASTIGAKTKGFKKGRFSFNMKGGRCEKCQGAGLIKIQMQFLPDVYVTCDVCKGQRYNQETLDVKYKGKTIYDILKMTVDEAADYFKNYYRIYQKLLFLQKVGLGYIELGQPAPTFSGGEAQRIKLANELSKRETGKTMYILDEPTTGLHFYDVNKLLTSLYQLVEKGNTVVVIEHNPDVIKNCQYVIDLGPDGGEKGGNVVYQGPVDGVMKVKESYTGAYMKKHIKGKLGR